MGKKRISGVCCNCGYAGDKETECPKDEDGIHCDHWWDGPEETAPELAAKSAPKKSKRRADGRSS